MITTPREAADFTTKQESNNITDNVEKNYSKAAAAASTTTSTTPWSRLKDPRIFRVSRAFGGKDRHSKVCTVKGLRDRRVRLSVPTAIQLYDLQDRLGLNQPSKAVDWLLNAAKHEINELPPLQMPPGSFDTNQQPLVTGHQVLESSQPNKEGFKTIDNWESNLWHSDASSRDKSKEVLPTDQVATDEKENWNQRNEEVEGGGGGEGGGNASQHKFFPRSNQTSSIPGLLNNVMPYNSFYRWDPSIFSLSHFSPQPEDHQHNINVVPLPSSLALPSGSQVLVCPPGTAAQPYFTSTSLEFDPKLHVNPFHMLSSTPLQLSMAHPNLLPSQSSSGSQSNKNDEFPPKMN